jgi:hypothetical protein
LEENNLLLYDKETIKELSTFEAKGSSYGASGTNHDDLVMNLVLLGWFTTNPFFGELTDINIKNMMYEENMARIEQETLPFGHINDYGDCLGESDVKIDHGDGMWLLGDDED